MKSLVKDAAAAGETESGAAAAKLGRARARIEGAAVLAIIGLTGLALWQLSDFADRPPRVAVEWSPCGERCVLGILTGGPGPAAGERPDVRAIISRSPIAFDPRRSIITFLDSGRRQMVPVDAGTLLAGEDGRVEAFRAHLVPHDLLDSLRMVPPAARGDRLRAWLTDPNRRRTSSEEPLRRLLGL